MELNGSTLNIEKKSVIIMEPEATDVSVFGFIFLLRCFQTERLRYNPLSFACTDVSP